MDILTFNLSWMLQNVLLAFLGMGFGLLFLHFKNFILKLLFFILWVLFLPNTIYLLTDLQYLPGQIFKLEFVYQLILIAQYMVILLLGVITFILGLYPLEKLFIKLKLKNKEFIVLVLFFVNYLIAFGVFLGKIQRVNSWDVFISPINVINSSLYILSSKQALILILLFGSLGNIIYFLYKNKIAKI